MWGIQWLLLHFIPLILCLLEQLRCRPPPKPHRPLSTKIWRCPRAVRGTWPLWPRGWRHARPQDPLSPSLPPVRTLREDALTPTNCTHWDLREGVLVAAGANGLWSSVHWESYQTWVGSLSSHNRCPILKLMCNICTTFRQGSVRLSRKTHQKATCRVTFVASIANVTRCYCKSKLF